ncbi:MAG TPA: ABC transporter ATP-binding protein [Bryobacteraceae bacterium]|nr:ABC transporter ATP-binding protein [Bryobacteraceae bacterium]
MLEARLRKTFPPRPDSAGFSLDLEFSATAGVTVLFGPSGAGKTLVLDSIAGFVEPGEGRILLDDDILFDGAARVNLAPQKRHCGYVFQNYALFPNMTLRENLQFAAERRPRLERHRRVNEMLEKFRLAEAAGRRPHEVSGGQRQRCSIARALIGAPKLLLFDEPATGLDAPLRTEFYAVLRQVQEEFKTPMLLVTHNLDECFELGEEMLVLRGGKIVQSGTPREILDQPANVEVARLLGAFNLLEGEIRSLDPGRNTSRVQVGEFEIEGPYFRGHLKGDRVTLCVRPEQLTVVARNGRPGPNQIPADLTRAIETPHGMRLEFSNGIAVALAHADHERLRDNRDWVIQFPTALLRVV